MVKKENLGNRELELLHYINDCQKSVSVKEVTDDYGEKNNLARTTILTTMENLRRKGYLARNKPEGVYKYYPRQSRRELLTGLVTEFVNNSLKGSLSPFVTYLAEKKELNANEVNELKTIINKIDNEDKLNE